MTFSTKALEKEQTIDTKNKGQIIALTSNEIAFMFHYQSIIAYSFVNSYNPLFYGLDLF